MCFFASRLQFINIAKGQGPLDGDVWLMSCLGVYPIAIVLLLDSTVGAVPVIHILH